MKAKNKPDFMVHMISRGKWIVVNDETNEVLGPMSERHIAVSAAIRNWWAS